MEKEKRECMSTAWRGKISVTTCSPPRVLENMMISDSVVRDVIFSVEINVTEGGMNACRDSQKVHRDSICGVEDGDVGTGPPGEGFSEADFWEHKGLTCFSHEADSSMCILSQENYSYLF